MLKAATNFRRNTKRMAGMPKKVRLLKRTDFSAVFDAPRVIRKSSPHFLLLARNSETGSARFGMAVAKKHLRTAVKRNIVKRLARESFRALQPELQAMDIVLLTKHLLTQDWPSLDNKKIRQELDDVLKKLTKPL